MASSVRQHIRAAAIFPQGGIDGTTDLVSCMARHSLAEDIWAMLDAVQRYTECCTVRSCSRKRDQLGRYRTLRECAFAGACGRILVKRRLPLRVWTYGLQREAPPG